MRKISSQSQAAATRDATVPRRRGLKAAFFAALLAATACVACSTGGDCKPTIPSGTNFKITVLEETSRSQKCHVVDIPQISPFQISAAKTEATAQNPSCEVTPAAAPPVQEDILIQGCSPMESGMLGVQCAVQYEAKCTGNMSFWFAAPEGKVVDWTASVIDGVYFDVQDDAPGCLDNINNCFDQYLVKLERLN
ncbi:MAG: hypothetical protein QM756_37755 [Polyangiaceae bacterium]